MGIAKLGGYLLYEGWREIRTVGRGWRRSACIVFERSVMYEIEARGCTEYQQVTDSVTEVKVHHYHCICICPHNLCPHLCV